MNRGGPVLCLVALLDSCESGAVEDTRHVIERVVLDRKILIGDDDRINKFGGSSGMENTNGAGTATRSHKAEASVSVTPLTTLCNLVA